MATFCCHESDKTGDSALVASRLDDDNGSNSGSAYLFDIATGDLVQKFLAPNGASSDFFGHSVALDGNYVLIGSYADDDNGNASGSTYLFDITTGDLVQKFLAPDAVGGDQFGWSVALDGDAALIGSHRDNNNGSAYLFDITTGDFLQKFLAPDGAGDDLFGYSVALDGDAALIGSISDDDNGSNSGSAYLFDITTDDFQKFLAPDGVSSDQFGFSVALDGNAALIGSYGDDDNGSSSGSAYLFDITTGDFLQKFLAPDGASDDQFGFSVALDGNSALISSRFDDDNGLNSGSAYLFAIEETPEKVPEPSAIGGLIALGILSAIATKKPKAKRQK